MCIFQQHSKIFCVIFTQIWKKMRSFTKKKRSKKNLTKRADFFSYFCHRFNIKFIMI